MNRPPASEIFTRFEKKQPRSRAAFLLAIVAHAIVIFVLASIAFHYPIRQLLQIRSHEKPIERIQYIHIAPASGGAPAGPANQDAAAPERTPREAAPPAEAPQAPTGVPTELPVGSSRVDLQACKLEYSIVSPK